jgi:cysteine desulfurase
MCTEKIYFDNAASTPLDPAVLPFINKYFSPDYANASSLHWFGRNSLKIIEKCRILIAQRINAQPEEIFFTSGGTESNNIIIKGVAFSVLNSCFLKNGFNKNNFIDFKNEIIISAGEHSSIHNTALWLENLGFKIKFVKLDTQGFIDLSDLKEKISKNTLLVSIIHANNETGVVQPVKQISDICFSNNILFHTDACQSFTKILFDVKNLNIDSASLNSHKMHGPKGTGALYISKTAQKNYSLTPLFHGGGQETGLRSGTYNTHGIAGFYKALELSSLDQYNFVNELKNELILFFKKSFPEFMINTPLNNSLPNIINISVYPYSSRDIFTKLSLKGIAVSRGSACASGKASASRTLTAMGLDKEHALSSLRISLSKFSTAQEVDIFKNVFLSLLSPKIS